MTRAANVASGIFYREREGMIRIEHVMHVMRGARDIGGDDFDVDEDV